MQIYKLVYHYNHGETFCSVRNPRYFMTIGFLQDAITESFDENDFYGCTVEVIEVEDGD